MYKIPPMFNSALNIENISSESVAVLARSYNLLDYEPKLQNIISNIFGITDFSNLSKFDLHVLINQTLISKYKGESTLKSLLVEEFVNKKVVAAFEIKVNTSRIDFLTINGDTQSFEIKSELDNLSKLSKQVHDYKEVFDFNNIVIDEKHYENAIKIIPEEYGIWTFRNGKKKILRKPTKNKALNSKQQLCLFTKKELKHFFKGSNSTEIIKFLSPQEINEIFKRMLKKRYEYRWDFVKNNCREILPIDYQFFFSSNIDPKDIYCR